MDAREVWAWVNREKVATPLLAVAFLLLSAYIVSLPHDLERKGHLKDEEGYYAWALLYQEGYYSLPLELATGNYESYETVAVDPEAARLEVETELAALDSDDKADDLQVTVAYENGTPVAGARVRIPLPGGEALEDTTDGEGRATLPDIPLGRPVLEVVLERQGQPPLVVRTQVEVGAGGGRTRYTISSQTQVEYLSNRTLGGLLEVRFPDDRPAGDFRVLFNGRSLGSTDENGTLALGELGVKQGVLEVRNREGDPAPGSLQLELAGRELERLDEQGRVRVTVVERVRLLVAVQDLFGGPVEGAQVWLRPAQGGVEATGESLGLSAANGTLTTVRELGLGEYQVTVRLEVDGYEPPLASGVGQVEGEYRYVNHWPPGPSVALLPLLAVGAEALFGTLMAGLTGLGTYGLGRRWWGWRVAWLGTAFTLSNGVVLMLHFGQWMGDLAAVAFALPGLWLVVEGAHHRNPWRGVGLALAGGVMLGVGVTMRYTTVLLCGAPYLYLAGVNLPPGTLKELPGRVRRALAWPRLKGPLTQAGALTLGLLLIGVPLAAYNAHYFGSAWNSGYQSKNTLQVSGSGDNQTITTQEPSVSMWDGYVNVGRDELENVGQVVKFGVAFFPVLLLMGPGLWLARRRRKGRAGALALSYWMVVLVGVYLTQSWVLNRTFTDIRYYLGLAPPAGLLAALGVQGIARGLPGALKLPRERGLPPKLLFVGLIGGLVLASGWVAFDDAQEQLQVRFSRQPGGPGPGGPGGGQAVQAPIFELVNQPDRYVGQTVMVSRAEVADRPGPAYMVLADDKHPEARARLVVRDLPVEAEVGDMVMVTARFNRDNKNPDGYSLFLNRAEDLEVTEPANNGGRGGEPTAVVAFQQPPQGGQPQPPKPPGAQQGQLDLSPGQRTANLLGVIAAVVGNGAAVAVFIAGRQNRLRGAPA